MGTNCDCTVNRDALDNLEDGYIEYCPMHEATHNLLNACQALCDAYAAGQERGGSIRWEDVDDAYWLAKEAIKKAGNVSVVEAADTESVLLKACKLAEAVLDGFDTEVSIGRAQEILNAAIEKAGG